MKVILWPMIWKEWRENARWAMLALVALGLALGYSLYAAGLNTSSDPASALWNGIAPVFLFGCPLLGAALGFAQVMPELRRDQWAFLVHRPVPRTTLFWGKAVTGLLLALGATALPLGLLGLWAALPGDVAAPFDIHLLLPGVAALLTIIPFYFAGMLLALRPARWYGSRLLPLAAAVLASILTRSLPEFWMAALAALVFGAVLCLAAWGCFATKGEYVGLPRPARAGLGVALYAGSGVVLVTLAVLVGSVGFNLFSQSDQVSVSTNYSIDAGGQVLQITQQGSILKSAKDLQGHYVILPQTTSGNGTKLEALQTAELVSPNRAYPHDGRRTDAIYTDTDRYVTFSSLTGYSRDVSSGKNSLWYYVPAERRWIGYWQKTRRVFGYLGPSGFSPLSQPDAPRFSVPYPAPTYEYGYQPALLRYPEAVYLLDTTAAPVPTLTTLYTAHTPSEIKGICQMRITTNAQTRRPTFITLAMVATKGQFLVYTPDGRRQFALPREHDPALYSDIDLSMTPDGQKFFFWYKPSDKARKAAGGSLPEYITETNATGTVTHRHTLPPLPVTPEPPQDTKPGVLGLLAPPLLTLTFYGISHREISRDTHYLPLFYLSSVLSLLSGIISAGLMALISRRGGDTRRVQIGWAVAGLLLGLFGVLMLLALRPWPVRVPCPNCGRLRAVDRDECPHCGAGFPRSARDGTEIFDGEAAAV